MPRPVFSAGERPMPVPKAKEMSAQAHEEADLRAARRVLRFAGRHSPRSRKTSMGIHPGARCSDCRTRPGGGQRHGQERPYRRKIAATFSSTGTPPVRSPRRSQPRRPWVLTRSDALMMLSNSGERRSCPISSPMPSATAFRLSASPAIRTRR